MPRSLNYPMLNLLKNFLILFYLNLMAILLNILWTYTQGSIKNNYKYQEQRVFTWWLHAATPPPYYKFYMILTYLTTLYNMN